MANKVSILAEMGTLTIPYRPVNAFCMQQ